MRCMAHCGGLAGDLAAELGLPLVRHLVGRLRSRRRLRGGPLSPSGRHAPLRGALFSRPAVESCGDAPEPVQRLSGDRVQHVLDRGARRSRAL